MHLALAFPEIPMIEYFPLPCWDDLPSAEIEPIFVGLPEPHNGQVTLAGKPGLGVKVNERIFAERNGAPASTVHVGQRA
jgi:hypothetical protein